MCISLILESGLMAQLSLYYQTQLETKVSLLPEQIDGDIDDHILENLRAKIEKKTIEHGIVIRIIRLIDYNQGMIDKANFMGTTVFKTKYECLLCSPIKDLEMTCIVDNTVRGYLICRNGPVIAAIYIPTIDTHTFKVVDSKIKNISTGKEVGKGDHLKVSVISISTNLREKNIVAMCKFLNVLTSKSDIKKFNEEQELIQNVGITEDVDDFF